MAWPAAPRPPLRHARRNRATLHQLLAGASAEERAACGLEGLGLQAKGYLAPGGVEARLSS